jgi:hypothetical protein
MSYKIWGNTVWYVFHGLAEKLKTENEEISKNLIHYYYLICNNLPCDNCSKHATELLKKCNINNINTKEKLKDFCWKLHNIVNKKLNKKEFTKEERDKLYEKINIMNVINNFKYVMLYDYRTQRGMMGTFKRKQITNDFLKYLNNNKDKFNI